MQDHKAKLTVLESKVVGTDTQVGNVVCQTLIELKTWIMMSIPPGHFGLFVDGHSFLEFFNSSVQLDTETSVAAENHSKKAGYITNQETQVAGSFKNLFPAIFGKGGAATIDDATCLPVVSPGNKWNNGSTNSIINLHNVNGVSYELDSSIKLVLQDYPEACQQATDCVTQSNLISFMSSEYAAWQQHGLGKKEAWIIVCQIVCKVLEDMQFARIMAQSSRGRKEIKFSTATFIHATLKCHQIMSDYMRHQCHDHPAVSAVITRHLAANFVEPEVSGNGGIR